MMQIKKLTLTHKKDLRVILEDFQLVLNDGDKAVIIGEEGNGKSTLLKWMYDPALTEDYIESTGERIIGKERLGYLPQELPEAKHIFSHIEWHMTGYEVTVDELEKTNEEGFLFIHPEQIKKEYSIPSAFEKYTEYAGIRSK